MVVSAPAVGGNMSLLRFWIAEAGLAERVGRVPVQCDEHDLQPFWISVPDTPLHAGSRSAAVPKLTPASDLPGANPLIRMVTVDPGG
jgi:hypothetical protein